MSTGRAAIGLNCLREPEREHGFEPLRPGFGQVPETLSGTLYRVGPGRFADASGVYGHWFDGEGCLAALRFEHGQVSFACRMIRPRGSDKSDYALRGRIGRAPKGFARRMRSFVDPQAFVNVANTALLEWQGQLFALFEASLPTEINPDTLETLGERDLGVIARSFGAHPHLHAPSGAVINQGFRPPPKAGIDYYRLPQDGPAKLTHSVPVSGRFPAHDMAVTEHHIVTIVSPLYMDLAGIIGGRAVADCLNWRPRDQTDCVISPVAGGSHISVKAEPLLYTHTANAYEEDGQIVVQGCAARDATPVDWVARVRHGRKSLAPLPSPVHLTELRIDPKTARVMVKTLFDTPAEFPSIDPRFAGRKHNVIYANGFRDASEPYADFQDAILRFDLASGTVAKLDFGAGHFVNEPVFVPDGENEGEGWLLCVNYDGVADSSYLAIVRAEKDMELVAQLPLTQPLPMSLHGLWVPS